MLAEGKVDPESLIEGVYSLDQGITAFERAARPGVLKILIQM
jgi:threonine dehydrogenase-like Zn-dependent dehydrogenase